MSKRCACLALCALLAASALACRTERSARRRTPTVHVVEEPLGENGPACRAGAGLDVVQGHVPLRARPIVRLRATSAAPVALDDVQRVLVAHARARCAEGLSIQQATAAEGALEVESVVAVAWARLPPGAPTPSPPPEDEAPEAPPDFQ